MSTFRLPAPSSPTFMKIGSEIVIQRQILAYLELVVRHDNKITLFFTKDSVHKEHLELHYNNVQLAAAALDELTAHLINAAPK